MKRTLEEIAADATHPNLVFVAFGVVWEMRPDMNLFDFAKIVQAVIVDPEVRAALIALWARRDRLTVAELDALRAQLDTSPRSAEELIDDTWRRWQAADEARRTGRHLRLVDEDGAR